MPQPDKKHTDYFIYNNIVNPISKQLCFIHPNFITIINLLLSIPLAFNLHNDGKIIYFIIIVFFNRFLDLLDGSIARSCDKQSKIGSILDILCDFLVVSTGLIMFIYKILKSNIHKNIKITVVIFIAILLLYLLYIVCLELFSSSWYKKINNNKVFLNKLTLFYHDNSLVLGFIIAMILKLIIMKIK
jgi:phosphatidylglycerophosphate synthase